MITFFRGRRTSLGFGVLMILGLALLYLPLRAQQSVGTRELKYWTVVAKPVKPEAKLPINPGPPISLTQLREWGSLGKILAEYNPGWEFEVLCAISVPFVPEVAKPFSEETPLFTAKLRPISIKPVPSEDKEEVTYEFLFEYKKEPSGGASSERYTTKVRPGEAYMIWSGKDGGPEDLSPVIAGFIAVTR